MTKTKTLAAALALSLAGASAAHACNTWLTVDNQRNSKISINKIYTQKSGGRPLLLYLGDRPVEAKSVGSWRLKTLRKKKTDFRVSIILADESQDIQSAFARCSAGHSITVR